VRFIFSRLFLALLPFGAVAQTRLTDTTLLEPIEVSALRAGDKTPFARTNLTAKDFRQTNLGVDLPVLLSNTPSAIFTSDAGNGVGYTGIRIRGTDGTRINVTINGIPYNDAESQGTFFVNIPDFISSANSVQIQRGVGSSTNGAGAFGASINLSTNEVQEKFYARLANSGGSYNTWKNTFQFGSGLLGKHFTIDGRLSRIVSDGYVDRAGSNLRALALSTAYLNGKHSLRFNIFSGSEVTYQAWNGIDAATLKTNRRFNPLGLEQPGSPYPNQTDNYKQTHYQLFYNTTLPRNWKASFALFLTRGKGYYEEYRAQQQLSDYGLPPYFNGSSVIEKTDLIRQLWLDNYFYGSTWALTHEKNNNRFVLGGAFTQYRGQHYGIIKWAQVTGSVTPGYSWYDLPALKNDFSVYGKWSRQWTGRWHSYADLQFRHVLYNINGFRKNPTLAVSNSFTFLNPKLGIVYAANNRQWYASFAVAGKEPNRDDFEAASNAAPKPETLLDWELGMEQKGKKFTYGANFFFMHYINQLVLTGEVNDVGAYTRTNADFSYRTGIELQANWQPASRWKLGGNLALSDNRILKFTEYIDDYDNGGQTTRDYRRTPIGFSPAVVGGTQLSFLPGKGLELTLSNRYVGRQYLDNTGQKSRSIDPYFVQDFRASFEWPNRFFRNTLLVAQVNNLFNNLYVSNGYTFSYVYGGLVTENYFFPMAPINFMLGLTVEL
jgi:iron complex outermembrane receptor protein